MGLPNKIWSFPYTYFDLFKFLLLLHLPYEICYLYVLFYHNIYRLKSRHVQVTQASVSTIHVILILFICEQLYEALRTLVKELAAKISYYNLQLTLYASREASLAC